MTKIRFGFKGKGQLPLFMIWKEFWCEGEVVGGSVIFSTGTFLIKDYMKELREFEKKRKQVS